MAEANTKNTVADNRRARFDYEIVETIQAGIVLTGTEIKSLRENKVTIGESYASVEDGELWLINSHIPEFLQANRFNHEPRRRRKLRPLRHRRSLPPRKPPRSLGCHGSMAKRSTPS